MNEMLKPCPCGGEISMLVITDAGQGGKFALVGGSCCGEWMIEFHTEYYDISSSECMNLAITAWNAAPRAN